MDIIKSINNGIVRYKLIGRLDTSTAPQLEAEINTIGEDVEELFFDFEMLEYISSAGLRLILACQKKMNKQGKMVIENVNDTVMDIFEITGFIDILTVKAIPHN